MFLVHQQRKHKTFTAGVRVEKEGLAQLLLSLDHRIDKMTTVAYFVLGNVRLAAKLLLIWAILMAKALNSWGLV